MDRLLAKSRINNARLDITGLLLYRPNGFIQTLEGPNEQVLNLLNTIRYDPRHKNVTIVIQEPIAERDFSDWSMGYFRLSEYGEGFNDFLSNTEMSEVFRHSPRRVHRLLATFRELFKQ
jgi:hypothetical protein